MLNEKGFLKVIDFGIARILRENEQSHTCCGTAEYIAPEVLNEEYSFAADIWSVGILMFEMRFGFTPFKSSNRV